VNPKGEMKGEFSFSVSLKNARNFSSNLLYCACLQDLLLLGQLERNVLICGQELQVLPTLLSNYKRSFGGSLSKFCLFS
jgi:hypothetical protein